MWRQRFVKPRSREPIGDFGCDKLGSPNHDIAASHSRSASYFFFSALCGLRLPMRPDSLPAFGSMTAFWCVSL